MSETSQETAGRLRAGRTVAMVSIVWWIATIGGIIWVINAND